MHQGWEAPKNVVAFYLKLFPDADYRIRQRAWWWAALSGIACMALSPFNFPPFPFAMKRLICCILLLLILRNTYYVGGILRKKTRAYFTGSNFFHFTKKNSLKGTDFRQDCQNTDLLVLGSIHNLSRGWAMMISLFFPFIFLKPPLIISGFFFLTPPQEMLIYQRKIS